MERKISSFFGKRPDSVTSPECTYPKTTKLDKTVAAADSGTASGSGKNVTADGICQNCQKIRGRSEHSFTKPPRAIATQLSKCGVLCAKIIPEINLQM